MISDKTIDAVRDLPIEDVLKSYGLQFRRRGSTWFASCPFHQERTPSFSITPGKNMWYCHSCHRGGDGIKFYMEIEGLDFSGAVEAIAKANNICIEYTKERKDRRATRSGKAARGCPDCRGQRASILHRPTPGRGERRGTNCP